MIHHGQRLPLGVEAGDDRLRVHAQLDHLESDAAPNRRILLSHPHDTTAALADFLDQRVGPDLRPRVLSVVYLRHLERQHDCRETRSRSRHETGCIVGTQQFLDPPAQVVVGTARLVKVSAAFGAGQCPGASKDHFLGVGRPGRDHGAQVTSIAAQSLRNLPPGRLMNNRIPCHRRAPITRQSE